MGSELHRLSVTDGHGHWHEGHDIGTRLCLQRFKKAKTARHAVALLKVM
jgi:hypothetical protein